MLTQCRSPQETSSFLLPRNQVMILSDPGNYSIDNTFEKFDIVCTDSDISPILGFRAVDRVARLQDRTTPHRIILVDRSDLYPSAEGFAKPRIDYSDGGRSILRLAGLRDDIRLTRLDSSAELDSRRRRLDSSAELDSRRLRLDSSAELDSRRRRLDSSAEPEPRRRLEPSAEQEPRRRLDSSAKLDSRARRLDSRHHSTSRPVQFDVSDYRRSYRLLHPPKSSDHHISNPGSKSLDSSAPPAPPPAGDHVVAELDRMKGRLESEIERLQRELESAAAIADQSFESGRSLERQQKGESDFEPHFAVSRMSISRLASRI